MISMIKIIDYYLFQGMISMILGFAKILLLN